MLNTAAGVLHVPVPQTPHSPDGPYVFRRPERVPQQPVGVQLHQPLAFLHVRLAPRKIVGVTRVHQKHLQAVLFQNVINGEPVNTSGLHGHRLDTARFQPRRHALQIRCPASKLPRTGCVSIAGGTATKWLSLPISIPAAFACTTSSPGSSEYNRRSKSFRCFRFPPVNRSYTDSFAIPSLLLYGYETGRSARLAIKFTNSPAGSDLTRHRGSPPPNNEAQQPKSGSFIGHQRRQGCVGYSLPRPVCPRISIYSRCPGVSGLMNPANAP